MAYFYCIDFVYISVSGIFCNFIRHMQNEKNTHRPVVDMPQTLSVPVVSFGISRLLKPSPILS